MGRFGGKKLPPHWVYLPSRRQVRDLLATLDTDVRYVTFDGTGLSTDSTGAFLLGRLLRRVEDGAWVFHLRLSGVREEEVGDRGPELAEAAVQVIRTAVEECLAQPPAETVKPTRVLLWFEPTPEGVISQCRVEPADLVRGRW